MLPVMLISSLVTHEFVSHLLPVALRWSLAHILLCCICDTAAVGHEHGNAPAQAWHLLLVLLLQLLGHLMWLIFHSLFKPAVPFVFN